MSSASNQINYIYEPCRYGVELAFALLKSCFHEHNERQAAQAEKRERTYGISPGAFDRLDTSSTGETFGLAFQDCDQPAMGRTTPARDNINVMETPYQVVLKRFQVSIHASLSLCKSNVFTQ